MEEEATRYLVFDSKPSDITRRDYNNYDNTERKYYFFDTLTGFVSWECPSCFRKMKRKRADDGSSGSRDLSIDIRPTAGLSDGWIAVRSSSKELLFELFFYHVETKQSYWNRPLGCFAMPDDVNKDKGTPLEKEIPDIWIPCDPKSQSGFSTAYYYNPRIKLSVLVPPNQEDQFIAKSTKEGFDQYYESMFRIANGEDISKPPSEKEVAYVGTDGVEYYIPSDDDGDESDGNQSDKEETNEQDMKADSMQENEHVHVQNEEIEIKIQSIEKTEKNTETPIVKSEKKIEKKPTPETEFMKMLEENKDIKVFSTWKTWESKLVGDPRFNIVPYADRGKLFNEYIRKLIKKQESSKKA